MSNRKFILHTGLKKNEYTAAKEIVPAEDSLLALCLEIESVLAEEFHGVEYRFGDTYYKIEVMPSQV